MKKATEQNMVYFRNRMRQLRGEYTAPDRQKIIDDAGGRCVLCKRKKGDGFAFGPTNYLKRRLLFKVYIDIHVIEGGPIKSHTVVMCCGCHMGYHLFNRLSEDAEMGVPLSKTVYQRCKICGELRESCMCCQRCGKAAKWCRCRPGRRRIRRRHV